MQGSWYWCPRPLLPAGSETPQDVPTVPSLGGAPCLGAPAARAYSQCLDGLQRGEEPLADGLQLVVIEGEQVEVLQVLERVHTQAVDLVGVEEAASTREAGGSLALAVSRGPRAAPAGGGYPLLRPGALLRSREGGRRALLGTQQRRACPACGCCASHCRHRSLPSNPCSGGSLETTATCFASCFRMQGVQESKIKTTKNPHHLARSFSSFS